MRAPKLFDYILGREGYTPRGARVLGALIVSKERRPHLGLLGALIVAKERRPHLGLLRALIVAKKMMMEKEKEEEIGKKKI